MRASARLLVSFFLVGFLLYILHNPLWNAHPGPDVRGAYPPTCDPNEEHDINFLRNNARYEQNDVYFRRSDNVEHAASRYRERRGRHPPPGFDAWFAYAQKNRALVIEDFFNQIYRDIEPFWGRSATSLKASVAGWPTTIKVRNGKVTDVPNQRLRTTVWAEMISKIASMLPDMDIPINHLDEARVLAPRKQIDDAMERAYQQRSQMKSSRLSDFRQSVDKMTMPEVSVIAPALGHWSRDLKDFRQAIVDTCPGKFSYVHSGRPLPLTHDPEDAVVQYVKNMTLAKDICRDPKLTAQHGALAEPATIDFTTTLMPIFTGSKLPLYNDIVIPEPAYYSDKHEFTGHDTWGDWSTYYPWSKKRHSLVWRGSATGGGIHDQNWAFFHRQRLISHLNASESDDRLTLRARDVDFDAWLGASVDAGFTKLYCDDAHDAKQCPDLGSHYRLVKPVKMGSQYKHKYLPDVDGNSVSERFRGFLLSNSAPIKATIFDDWHDHRLTPWEHYIPMHMSYRDLDGIIKYFLGYASTCAHDAQGQKIADSGRLWAQQVLRREDMLIYVHRVLLEFARVVHEDRDRLGYVDDLLRDGHTHWTG